MSVLTESALRDILKNKNISEYVIDRGAIITPSARQYLQDKSVKLVYKNDNKISNIDRCEKIAEVKENKVEFKYQHINGGFFEKKPEHMTHLNGNKLVAKNHRRIVLRGRLDSFQAQILKAEILCKNLNEGKVLKELEEILAYVRIILACELTEKPLPEFKLIGLDEKDMREYSHNPKKYFGIEHIMYPSYEMGDVVVKLNFLRAYSREVEITAINAFKNLDNELSRNDIALAMNRLSSCFYVMMCKYVGGKYK